MARHDLDFETAGLLYLLVLTGAAGIGLVAWLLTTVAEAAHTYAAAAGAGGVSVSLAIRRKGK
jgi:hypothetical protein